MIKKKETNQEDKKIWDEYIRNPSDIYDKDQSVSNNTQEKGVINLIYMVLPWMKLIAK